MPNKEIKIYPPQVDYLVFKAEIEPPSHTRIEGELHDHINYGKELILKYLSIPDIDTDIIERSGKLLKFSHTPQKINFQIKKDRKNKLTIMIEAQGSYFIREGKTVHEQVWIFRNLVLELGKKMKCEMILKEIHIATDISGSMNNIVGNIDHILFAFPHSRPASFMNGNRPHSGTHYIANESAIKHGYEWEVCIYDKTFEIGNGKSEKNQIYKKKFAGEQITRVEARLFTKQAKKWTRHFYEMKDQSALCQEILSHFGDKKRAYKKNKKSINAYKHNNLSKQTSEILFWKKVFNPLKSSKNLNEKFFIETSGTKNHTICKKLEKLFIQADKIEDFEEALRQLYQKKDALIKIRKERKEILAKQESLFEKFSDNEK